jgi:hypothetical protein
MFWDFATTILCLLASALGFGGATVVGSATDFYSGQLN